MNNQIIILNKAKYLLVPSRSFRMTLTLNVAKVQKKVLTQDIAGQQRRKKEGDKAKEHFKMLLFYCKKSKFAPCDLQERRKLHKKRL